MVEKCIWLKCKRDAEEGSNYCVKCIQKYIGQERKRQLSIVRNYEREKEGTLVRTYRERDRILLELEYKTYQDYLNSDVWKAIRRRVFDKCGNECKLCHVPADVIHHKGYGRNVLLGMMLEPLIPLCNKCHKKVEFYPDGKKRSLVDTNSYIIQLLNEVNPKQVKQKQPKGRCKKCGKRAKAGKEYCRPCRLSK